MDTEHMAKAQALAGVLARGSVGANYGDVAGLAPAPQAGLLGEAAGRLQHLSQLLELSGEQLVSVNTRLFGPRPASTSAAGGGRGQAINGMAGDLLTALDALIERAQAVAEEARGINSRI